jgi:pseudouridine-5'-phosphate glycosidase/pseudouridine kinase
MHTYINSMHTSINTSIHTYVYTYIHQPMVLTRTDLLILDGNLTPSTISTISTQAHKLNIPIFFEPTSTVKCTSIVHAVPVTVVTPNEDELRAMHAALVKSHGAKYGYNGGDQNNNDKNNDNGNLKTNVGSMDSDSDINTLAKDMIDNGWVTDAVIITRGARGVSWVAKNRHTKTDGHGQTQTQTDSVLKVRSDGVSTGTVPALTLDKDDIVNTTGAGDTFAGVFAYSWLWGSDLETCVSFGQEAAVLTLMSGRAVAAELSDNDDD